MQELLVLLLEKEKMVNKLKRRLVNYQAKAEEEGSLRNRLEEHEALLNDVYDLKRDTNNDFDLIDE